MWHRASVLSTLLLIAVVIVIYFPYESGVGSWSLKQGGKTAIKMSQLELQKATVFTTSFHTTSHSVFVSVKLTFTFTFRKFSKCFCPKRLTMSIFCHKIETTTCHRRWSQKNFKTIIEPSSDRNCCLSKIL